jgi:hypothetical protein
MIFSLRFFFLKTILAATLHCILWQQIKIITHVLIKTGTDNNYIQQNLTCRKLYTKFVFCRYLFNQMRQGYIHICVCVCVCIYTHTHIPFSTSEFTNKHLSSITNNYFVGTAVIQVLVSHHYIDLPILPWSQNVILHWKILQNPISYTEQTSEKKWHNLLAIIVPRIQAICFILVHLWILNA